VDARDEDTLTASDLARAVGVSPNTIVNWTERHDQPLRTVATVDGAVRFTWTHLEDFCNAHPRLPGVRKIRRRAIRAKPESSGEPADTQIEELKSVVRDLRSVASAHLQAAVEAARQAEEVARSHRVQVEHLATAFAAYDDALSQITAPSTLHD